MLLGMSMLYVSKMQCFFQIGSSPETLEKRFFTTLERRVKQKNSPFKKIIH